MGNVAPVAAKDSVRAAHAALAHHQVHHKKQHAALKEVKAQLPAIADKLRAAREVLHKADKLAVGELSEETRNVARQVRDMEAKMRGCNAATKRAGEHAGACAKNLKECSASLKQVCKAVAA